MTPDEIYAELMFVISLNGERAQPMQAMLPTETYTLEVGAILWRGRSLNQDDHILPLRGMNSVSDAWEPPSDKVKSAGRLNKPGESLLYTSYNTPLAVPDEIRVQDNVYFSLMKYQVTEKISLTGIGIPITTDHLTPEAAKGADAISKFLGRQFSRKNTSKDGVRYQLAELIAKYNYDLPPAFHHGWIYPSVERDGAWNVTLRPAEAHAKLTLTGISICKADRQKDEVLFSGVAYTDGREVDGQFTWSKQGSPLQIDLFPEFGSEPGINEN